MRAVASWIRSGFWLASIAAGLALACGARVWAVTVPVSVAGYVYKYSYYKLFTGWTTVYKLDVDPYYPYYAGVRKPTPSSTAVHRSFFLFPLSNLNNLTVTSAAFRVLLDPNAIGYGYNSTYPQVFGRWYPWYDDPNKLTDPSLAQANYDAIGAASTLYAERKFVQAIDGLGGFTLEVPLNTQMIADLNAAIANGEAYFPIAFRAGIINENNDAFGEVYNVYLFQNMKLPDNVPELVLNESSVPEPRAILAALVALALAFLRYGLRSR